MSDNVEKLFNLSFFLSCSTGNDNKRVFQNVSIGNHMISLRVQVGINKHE